LPCLQRSTSSAMSAAASLPLATMRRKASRCHIGRSADQSRIRSRTVFSAAARAPCITLGIFFFPSLWRLPSREFGRPSRQSDSRVVMYDNVLYHTQVGPPRQPHFEENHGMAKPPKNHGNDWTSGDIKQLKQLAQQNTPTRVIGLKMG